MTTFEPKDLYYRAGFLDPAGGKQAVKGTRARQAIIIVGVDQLTRIFVLYAWAGRLPVSQLYDKIFEVNEDYRPNVFGIEANAMQAFIAEAVHLEAKRRFERLPVADVSQPTRIDKDFRIRSILQPVVGWGRLFLRADQVELQKEIINFPMSPIKDMVDALASAVSLLPARPPDATKHNELDALAKYLRDSGMSPHLIEDRLAQLKGPASPSLDAPRRSIYTRS
jgi:hypothetical protein